MKDPMKHWRIRLWRRTSSLPRRLLSMADAVDDWNSRLHAKWYEKHRCTALNEDGERCLMIPGIGGCGPWEGYADLGDAPHCFESEMRKRPWEGLPYRLSRDTRTTDLKSLYFPWRHTKFIGIHLEYEGTYAGSRMAAWAREEDAALIAPVEAKPGALWKQIQESREAEQRGETGVRLEDL